ncbi:hypothetical protein Nepgr_026454 [Nepenthes gracilis]|uniref:Uncharacterized protein n=1 Tax=Nepenthes gracilis TaxID=150966 RepID=A0AAD3T8L7_NEPGR|nr:hypothetical protein Nepgr_026454 [Nepenthes gracilis]
MRGPTAPPTGRTARPRPPGIRACGRRRQNVCLAWTGPTASPISRAGAVRITTKRPKWVQNMATRSYQSWLHSRNPQKFHSACSSCRACPFAKLRYKEYLKSRVIL